MTATTTNSEPHSAIGVAIAEVCRVVIEENPPLYLMKRSTSRRGIDTIAVVYATRELSILSLTGPIARALGLEYDDLRDGIIMRGMTPVALIGKLGRLTSREIAVEWI